MRTARRFVLVHCLGLTLALLCDTAARADVAPSASAASLCAPAQTVLFDCSLHSGKRASICASGDLGPAAGSLQYVFGRRGRVEVQWPVGPEAADWRGSIKAGEVMYAGGGGAYLRLQAGPREYVVYSASGRGWGRKAGVMVLRAGQPKSVQRCVGPAHSLLGPSLRRQANLSADEQELELPSP